MCSALCVRHVQTWFKNARDRWKSLPSNRHMPYPTLTLTRQVYKFERLQPLSYYASAEQRSLPAGAGLFWRADPGQEALVARCRMLRCAQPAVQGCNTGGGPGFGHAARRPARVCSGAPTLVKRAWSQAAACSGPCQGLCTRQSCGKRLGTAQAQV